VTSFRFEVVIQLKPGLLDPQGKTVQESLPRMGWDNVTEVRVGKHVRMTIVADTEEAARARAEEIAERFLSNPVIEEAVVRTMEEA
jgi:phosphoribosylformylglycinamidine synthase